MLCFGIIINTHYLYRSHMCFNWLTVKSYTYPACHGGLRRYCESFDRLSGCSSGWIRHCPCACRSVSSWCSGWVIYQRVLLFDEFILSWCSGWIWIKIWHMALTYGVAQLFRHCGVIGNHTYKYWMDWKSGNQISTDIIQRRANASSIILLWRCIFSVIWICYKLKLMIWLPTSTISKMMII